MDFELDLPTSFDSDAIMLQPIYQSLHDQKCILVLGPDLATFEENGSQHSLLRRFSLILAQHLQKYKIDYDTQQADNLPYVALRWLREVKGVQSIHLRSSLRKFYTQQTQLIPQVYKALAQLPFFMVLNTTHDDYMYRAFLDAGKKANHLHYNYQRNQTPLIPPISPAEPLVYNLFGKFDDEESLVITVEDQMDFIDNMLKNVSGLPNEIMSHFGQDKTFLFLGFDTNANRWHLPLLFRSMRLDHDSSVFYLDDDKDSIPLIKLFYEDSFNFHFVDKQILTFIENIQDGLKEWQQNHSKSGGATTTSSGYIDRPQPDMQSGRVKVLVMTSNPKDTATLDLEKEINSIKNAHRRASKRDAFEIDSVLNIQKSNLLSELLHHEPQIIHFSGHGSGANGLNFYSKAGYSDEVGGAELTEMFRQFQGISCVVLNACYSEEQAKIISKYIPNVVGTDNAIGDDVACTFSEGFYQALFAGKTFENAFFMAMAHVGMAKFPAGGRPVFYKNGEKVERE